MTAESTPELVARARQLLDAAEARETAWRTEPCYWNRWTWDVVDSLGYIASVHAAGENDRGAQALAELFAAAPELVAGLIDALAQVTAERDAARSEAVEWRHRWCEDHNTPWPIPLPWEDR